MKKFIKERNPFLLISFIISVAVFLHISYGLISIFSEFNEISYVNDMKNYATKEYVDIIILGVVFLGSLFNASIFSIVGHIFKKKEFIVVSFIIVMIIAFMCTGFNSIIVSIISIIWCIISAIGLILTDNY